MKQKGFIQIPLLAAVILVSISAVSIGSGVILYKQQKIPYFTSDISEIIYKTVYERGFEMEKLRQEAELSKTKKERAEKYAQKEIVKRTEAEVARGEAEQISREERTKRVQEEKVRKVAEQKAKEEAAKRAKEELERKIAEQKLSEKEAEERRMNADNDGDGLTLREEEQLGTSDLDLDSDDDGINDGEDSHPAGGGRLVSQTFNWSYGGYNWTYTTSIQEDWFSYYRAKPRGSHPSIDYITSDDPFIKKISKKILDEAEKTPNVSETWLAVSFVQNLPYIDDIFTGYNEYPKYPVETFFEKNGDCEDASYLAASIIDAMGYGSVLILLPGHMAVGVYMNCDASGTYYQIDGRCYYYVETTGKNWPVGEIPEEHKNQKATLIEIPSGETVDAYPQYNKPCDASSDFSGYYYDGSNYYSDSQCNNLVYCLRYEEYYFNYKTEDFYWDSGCNQIITKGCSKSTNHQGYFYNGIDYYSDSRCIQKARVCRSSPNYSDTYYDGYNEYWDSNCTQKVVSWCSKSIYHPGYFFSDLDYEYYYDSQCTQLADPY